MSIDNVNDRVMVMMMKLNKMLNPLNDHFLLLRMRVCEH